MAVGVFFGKKKNLKLVVVPILVLFFLAIATKTQTRMALITALSAPVFSLILCSERKKRLKYFFAAGMVGILGFFALNMVLKSDLMTEGAKARYQEEDLSKSQQSRFAFWAEGLKAFSKRPLHGYGFVNSPYVLQKHKGRSVHNNFVAVVVELGLIGFALLGAIFIVLYNKIKKVLDLRLKWLGMAMLFYCLLTGLTSVNYIAKDFWYALTVAMLCALIDGIEQLKASDRSNT
jgi:O-antigen ligase